MNAPRPLHPARALLTPTWVVALALLAVNDHLLKAAAPGVVTGKLSDFAGMVVAPTLLASALALRSRRGLLAAHVAIGAVFAAINLSRGAADLWCRVMATIAGPWEVVVDPWDLVALPALLLSWRVLVPAMGRPIGPAGRQILAGGAAALGLLVCTATSRAPAPPDGKMVFRDDMISFWLYQHVEGTFELRCDDGARHTQVVAGQRTIDMPLPESGTECKMELLGLPGTVGPITVEHRWFTCDLRDQRLACEEARGYP